MKKYISPEIEFELFEIEDVITVSIIDNEGGYPSGSGANGWD